MTNEEWPFLFYKHKNQIIIPEIIKNKQETNIFPSSLRLSSSSSSSKNKNINKHNILYAYFIYKSYREKGRVRKTLFKTILWFSLVLSVAGVKRES